MRHTDSVRAHASPGAAVARRQRRAAGRRHSAAGCPARRDRAAFRRSRDAVVAAPGAGGGRRASSYLWGPIDFRGPALLDDLEEPHLPDLLVLRPVLFGVADPREAEAEHRSGDLPRQDRVRRHHRGRAVRRVRDAVLATARCRACRSTPRSPTTSCPTASSARRGGRVRVATVVGAALAVGLVATALPAWWAAAATVLFAAALSLARHAVVRRRLLAEPVAAGARLVVRAVRRRRLPVLLRRAREAEDEEAVRPVRLEGRLRAAGGESGAGASRRSAAGDDRAVLRYPRLHHRLRTRPAGRNRRHAERVFHAHGRPRLRAPRHARQVRRRHGDGAVRRAARRSRSTPTMRSRRRSRWSTRSQRSTRSWQRAKGVPSSTSASASTPAR